MIRTLEQLAQDALEDAAAAQIAANAAAADLARLQSQLTMLQANSSDTGHITWWRADTVDAEGRISQEVLGNGLITRRNYDAATGHLMEIKTGGAGINTTDNDLQDVGYAYDAADNVQYRWDHNIRVDTDYQYDNLDRLTSVRSMHPTNPMLNWTIGYVYDEMGNFSGVNHGGIPITYSHDTQVRSTANGAWTTNRKRLTNVSNVGNVLYDANGNITQSGNRAITWDANNYPLSITDGTNTAAYTYGPARNRLTKVESRGGLNYKSIYAPGYERSEVTGGWFTKVIENRYPIIVNGRLVATRLLLEWPNSGAGGASTWTRRAEYYHEDALNNVELVTDSVGRIMKRFYYDPFGYRYHVTAYGLDDAGLVRQDPFYTFVQRGLTGHEHLDELGLIHMNGRLYDTQLRRFLSADPLIQAPRDTQSYNRYAYVKNNPLKYTDPSGFSWLSNALKKLKKYIKPILAVAITIAAPYMAPATWGAWGAVFAGAVGGFSAGLVASGGDLRAGLVGALTGAAFAGIGNAYKAGYLGGVGSAGARISKVALHGLTGGLSSTANGGKFGPGFLSSSFSDAFAWGAEGASWAQGPAGVVVASLVGGTAAELGGGKFANGAVTGAFSYTFNSVLHDSNDRHAQGVAEESERMKAEGFEIRGTDVRASVDGLPFARRYDILAYNPASDTYFGVEVKTTIGGGFRLNAQQVAFDVETVRVGALAVDQGVTINGVMYRGTCFGCGVATAWRTTQLLGILKAADIPFGTTANPSWYK